MLQFVVFANDTNFSTSSEVVSKDEMKNLQIGESLTCSMLFACEWLTIHKLAQVVA